MQFARKFAFFPQQMAFERESALEIPRSIAILTMFNHVIMCGTSFSPFKKSPLSMLEIITAP